jgi:serine/threonine protein kinase
MPRKVLGEGGYGCVHKPSLHCMTPPAPNFDYSKYVSKLMKTKNANEELREFVTIHTHDPKNEYHLGTPILCKPDVNDATFIKDAKKCKRIYPKLQQDPNKVSLLVLKYGGPDLKQFCMDNMTKFLKTNAQQKSDKFWLEVHHLIKGLKFFRDNGIVHNDLKPQNILYDMKKNKLTFIDFGLMKPKPEIVKLSEQNKNPMANFHWSFPIECGFMSYNEYSKYKRSIARRTLVKNEIIGMIVAGDTKNTANLDIPRPEAFELFFTYINSSSPQTDMPSTYKYVFYDSAFDGLYKIKNLDYSEYLEKIIDSIDVYGLGFTLQYILNCFKRHNGIAEDFFIKASALFAQMFEPDITERVLDIKVLLDEYEDILLETGLLARMNKSFEDNMLVNRAPMPSPIMRLAEKEERSTESVKPLSSHLERIADMDPVPKKLSKICPPEKEVNPATNRCVKRCEPGQTRNAKFRCKKNKTKKSNSKTRSNSKI